MTHPVSAIPYHDGRLSDLLNLLSVELHGTEPGTFASRRTRQGPTVSLCVGEDGRRILRIYADTRPRNGDIPAWNRYDAIVEIMVMHLGCSKWKALPIDPEYPASRVYQEPTLVEAK